MKNRRKLVLFDIDGTLIYHLGMHGKFDERVRTAARRAFAVEIGQVAVDKYHGFVDRQSAWDIVRHRGVSRKIFLQKFPEFVGHMRDFLQNESRNGQIYQAIDDAKKFALLLKKHGGYCLGLITGNVESIAWWKLEHAGLGGIFSFGVFGDEVDDRIALAQSMFAKAQDYFQQTFKPEEVMVVGDTTHDARCARAIGAGVILVTTGGHRVADLRQARPDFLVDSLLDQRVLDLFNLPKS